MTTIRCRHCPETFPNPIRMRAHTRADHPEYANQAAISSRTIIPVRGPRPAGPLKRETDSWPARP